MLGRHKVIALTVLAALLVAAVGWGVFSHAATSATIGYVDMAKVWVIYVEPELVNPVKQEMEKLQAELDTKLKDLTTDEEKRKVFDEYQTLLDQRKEELKKPVLDKIQAALNQVAKEQGVDVVLRKQVVLDQPPDLMNQAVMYGGVDLTDQLLLKLGVKTQDQKQAK